MKIDIKTSKPVYSCKKAFPEMYYGEIIWNTCPCYKEADSSGPAYCILRRLETDDFFSAEPDFSKCPLRRNA